MLSKFYPLLICTLFLSAKAGAQHSKLDSVAQNIRHYALNTAQSSLFIHFDKNIYTNNDQVWFTGYLLKSITGLDQYHTLYLSLVNNTDSSVVLQEKFMIDKGFSFGGITLPDSLPSGSYRFVANTNIKRNNQPDGEFIQPITIKSTTINPLTANISIFKAFDAQSKNGTALIKVLTGTNRFVENAEIRYQIGKNKQLLLSGTAKSSVIGELMLDFPADRITADNNELAITVKKGKDVRYAKFNLPVPKLSNHQIRFYPEGGYLVNGLMCKVGFEVKDMDGTVLKAKAVLYENDVPIDTIQSNSTGIGSFTISPRSSKNYYVKLLKEDKDDVKYGLPIVLDNGVVLTAGNVIAENDFRIRLEANNPKKVHVVVHNFSDILLQTSVMLEPDEAQNIRFKLDSVPVGLNAVSILDSNYRPIAERIFFAHYDRLDQAELSTDKNGYGTRDQVKLNLDVYDRDKKPVTALVSIACVQSNRISNINSQNIADYFYLQQYLEPLPNRPMGIKYVDQAYLNDVLLVKTWSRYKWPETEIPESVKDRILSTLEYRGKIMRKNKPLDKPMGLTVIAGENLNFLNTDSIGQFDIPYANLIIKEPRVPVWLGLATTKYDQYEVKIDNPIDEIKKYIVQQKFELPTKKADVLNEVNQDMLSVAGIKLKEVVITKNKDESTDFAKNAYANKCGDYVCLYNILNCPNHTADFRNTSPVKGKIYKSGKGGSVLYQGCTDREIKPNIIILQGINFPKEFYESDVSNKNEPINFATVYWNYQVLVNGRTPITFNTGDLTGKFKIIVQGVTDGGVVYGEKEIEVRGK